MGIDVVSAIRIHVIVPLSCVGVRSNSGTKSSTVQRVPVMLETLKLKSLPENPACSVFIFPIYLTF